MVGIREWINENIMGIKPVRSLAEIDADDKKVRERPLPAPLRTNVRLAKARSRLEDASLRDPYEKQSADDNR